MSFSLYEICFPEGRRPAGKVELSGKSGLFACFVGSRSVRTSDHFEWRLTAPEILSLAGFTRQGHELIIERNTPEGVPVAYACVQEVFGFSRSDSTSVLLRLEPISPGVASEEPRTALYQLLQLNGGTVKQDWSWVPDGPEGAPLFSPEVMESLIRSIGRQLSPDAVEVVSPVQKRVPTRSQSSQDSAEVERLAAEMRRDLDELFGSSRENSPATSIHTPQVCVSQNLDATADKKEEEAPSRRRSSIDSNLVSHGRKSNKRKVSMVPHP
jgi:hypothetical protein